ncbi:unnamed protein product [Phyllotreta striolata]|uniref:Protein SERAC1 n=1 Tax=Phyllotreta striolata TaxID=444603 RepID=A0A9N9XMN2_PHYSR|nr:unnamed protein product [Phyllotreta striolata]
MQTKYNNPRLFKYIGLSLVGISSGWLYYQVKQTYNILENTVDSKVMLMKNILEDEPKEEEFIRIHQNSSLKNDVFTNLTNSLKFAYTRRLVRLANTGDKNDRTKAVKALAKMKNLSNWHCSLLSNMMNSQTAVALARSDNVDQRLFMEPPLRYHNYNRKMLISAMREFLIKLYEYSHHPCMGYFLSEAFVYEHLRYVEPIEEQNNTHIVDHDSSSLELSKFIQSERDILPKCLESILHHCSIENYSRDVVKFNGLPLLMEIYQRYIDNPSIAIILCQIISYISLNNDLLEYIHKSGWIGILSEWVNNKEIRISVPAARALANLDVDNDCKYSRRLYPLHPLRRASGKQDIDVVFVHGLLGGVFYTWRQRVKPQMNLDLASGEISSFDLKNVEKDFDIIWDDLPVHGNQTCEGPYCSSDANYKLKNSASTEDFTQCWPKDWLSEDVKNIRILGINYATRVSMWAPICPSVKMKLTLEERSSDLLLRLIEAGLGTKPIVWVTHSMGGLIVKKLLCKAFDSDVPEIRNVCLNTKGIFFYSTPHKGCRLASLSQASALLLWPSVEVQELRENSLQLANMHEKFLNIVNTVPMKIVTFAETKSTIVTAMKLNFFLVERPSGDPGVGEYFEIPQDHLSICKPVTRYSFLYQKVVHIIKEILKEASR